MLTIFVLWSNIKTLKKSKRCLTIASKIFRLLSLPPGLRRMLCNVLVQPHFDYAYPTWYPNLNGKLKKTANNANKCIRFCLKLDKMHQNISDRNITWQNMYVDYFKTMNWLSVDQWVQQRLNITIFIYVNNVCLISWKKSLNMLHKVE